MNTRKKFLLEIRVRPQNGLPRAVVQFPGLEVFKRWVDTALRTWFSDRI